MKQPENSEEAHQVFVGDIDSNISHKWRSDHCQRKVESGLQKAQCRLWFHLTRSATRPIPCPPRSPGLTPRPLYLGGYVKARYTNLRCHNIFASEFHRA
jgi:hypothetical protein